MKALPIVLVLVATLAHAGWDTLDGSKVYRVCSMAYVGMACARMEVCACMPILPACLVPTPGCAVYDDATNERVENLLCASKE